MVKNMKKSFIIIIIALSVLMMSIVCLNAFQPQKVYGYYANNTMTSGADISLRQADASKVVWNQANASTVVMDNGVNHGTVSGWNLYVQQPYDEAYHSGAYIMGSGATRKIILGRLYISDPTLNQYSFSDMFTKIFKNDGTSFGIEGNQKYYTTKLPLDFQIVVSASNGHWVHTDIIRIPSSGINVNLPNKFEDAIAFSNTTGTVNAGNTATYALSNTGRGNGAITYSSSNTAVATVNATTGAVNGISAGTTTITATKATDGIFESVTASYTLKVEQLTIDSSTVNVSLSQTSYVYDGTAKQPTVNVSLKNGTQLIKDTHYTVSYTSNVNAGTATVTITGKGNYSGSINSTFTITAKSISNAVISIGSYDSTYTGSAINPPISVTDGGSLIVSNQYTVSYSSNISAGINTAIVTITAKTGGNYSGTKTASYTITPKAINTATVNLGTNSYIYDGSAKTPTVTSVILGGVTLSSSNDYTVSYTSNINAGTATVTITGKGNYNGTATKTFTITSATLSNGAINFGNFDYTFTGSDKTPPATITVGSTTLFKDIDYTLSWTNNVNVGTATLTVIGKGNYQGEMTKLLP